MKLNGHYEIWDSKQFSRKGRMNNGKKSTKEGSVEIKRKVTLDCHNGEVKAKDVKSIVSQANLSKSDFLKALSQ